MLRDVFYYGKKPNVHPREKFATSFKDARSQCTTEHFWIINEYCDYQGFDWDFDFEFLPDEDVWAEEHNNVWPSQHQKDSGTWLCSSEPSEIIIYRADVSTVKRKNVNNSNWVLDLVDETKFDFSWHPDPTEPPYIYTWGCKFFPVELQACLEYHTPGATTVKYMNSIVELLPETERWIESQAIDKLSFDMSWRPSPLNPPMNYVWGNKYIDGRLLPTLEYRMPGATDTMYMPDLISVLPEWERWVEVQEVNKTKFDFSWRPDPREPAYIYTWGNKYIEANLIPTLEYHCEGATERKYMSNDVEVMPEWHKWEILHPINKKTFDFTWRPDPREPNLNYVFGNEQYDSTKMPTIIYKMDSATDEKHMLSMAKLLPHPNKFEHLEDSYGIDYSWVPDPTSPPYIYVWGNQWNKPEDKISIQYVIEGATEYKYMEERATRRPCKDYWVLPSYINTNGFDFSWEPSPADPPYIYQFGTQWQKTGGPKYVVEGATEVKYIDIQKVKRLPNKEHWEFISDAVIADFDYSWHPDETDEAFIYVFGNNQYPAEIMPTIQYVPASIPRLASGAAIGQVKYVNDIIATLGENKTNWVTPNNIDTTGFDFSWVPHPDESSYIYEFGTQWQKTGGPKYIVTGATEMKYVDTQKVKTLPNKNNFEILDDNIIADFDYSWHPDNTDDPYIYIFGNNQYPAEIMPTVQYVPKNTDRLASGKPVGQIKYVNDIIATLGDNKKNWIIPDNIDVTDFDFSWVPDPHDDTYIYQFGTQWQKTGGPQYILPNIVKLSTGKYLAPIKYVAIQKAKALPNMDYWEIINNNVIVDFDYSWHPDNVDEPYLYVFGNNQYPAEVMPTVQYVPASIPRLASGKAIGQIKYVNNVVATLGDNKKNWIIPDNIDATIFDFSWVPHPHDDPYIYQFGTQWQKTGGPKYIMPGATETKYIDNQKVKSLLNKNKFNILNGNVVNFDYSWHPDDTEEPYIYVFGNNQYPAEIMPTIEYVVPGATQIKYVNNVVATLGPNKTNWKIIQPINENKFDFSWVPNPKDPPYTYVWGNKYISNLYKHTIEYHVEGATEIKYMDELVEVLPELDRWVIPTNIDDSSFDYTWRPDPLEADFIWQFGTQWQKTGGPRYIMPGATEVKYIDTQKAKALPNMTYWEVIDDIVIAKFDYSWHPDDTDEPYIYQFGNNQYPAEEMPTIQYVPKNTARLASGKAIGQVKYVNDIVATLGENKTNWVIPKNVDTTDFDFSWMPHPHDEPYIYQFGTQWQKTGGPKYIAPGIVKLANGNYLGPIKYVKDFKVNSLEDKTNWIIPNNIDVNSFDFSWHPDNTDSAYIYEFGTQWQKTGGPKYIVEGATETKYVDTQLSTAIPTKTNWEFDSNVMDVNNFDFSWHPYSEDESFVYQFGTQWQKTGGPKYITPGVHKNSAIKYIDIQKIKRLPNIEYFEILDNNVIVDFDYSWHPDDTDDVFIYVFGNNQYPAEIMPTIQYVPKNIPIMASGKAIGQIKYVNDIVATLGENKTNWIIPDNIDVTEFDFSWVPDPHDDTYIYQFGTQWQKTGGPKYIVKDATELKYVDTQKAKALPNKNNFEILDDNVIVDFDYSWHPDDTDEPYIYQFGNNQYPAEIMPTIQYVPSSITRLASGKAIGQNKYVNDIVAVLGENKTNWIIPNNVDTTGFDFSWVPNPHDGEYIYQFGTQWQKTGGPRYVVEGATEVKYVNGSKAKSFANKKNFTILDGIVVADFDYSWHPDETDEQYIYVFGNNQYPAAIMPTIQYVPESIPRLASGKPIGQIKYVNDIVATLGENKSNWIVPENVDTSEFDFSWVPNPHDDTYIYQFGTQWQKTGGPKYIVEGATEVKYIDIQKAKALPNKKNFTISDGIVVADFDYSWQPDDTDEQYIYVFGNNQYPAEIMPTIEYVPESIPRLASGKPIGQIKYVNDIVAILGENKTNWVVPDNVDTSEFDFSWVPDPHDDTYIYQFGTQWQKTGGPKYITPGVHKNSAIKYIDAVYAKALVDKNNWVLPPQLNILEFDFSWHPDSTDDPYIYEFGTQWHDRGGPKYIIKGATDVKYITTITATLGKSTKNWEIPDDVDTSEFDFSWVPHPNETPYIYQFGTQHQKTGGPKYIVKGAIEIKYIDVSKAKKLPSKKYWFNPNQADTNKFDYSWHPDETAPPYIYQFGTLLDKEDGPRYMTPNSNGEIIYLERIEAEIVESVEISKTFPKYVVTTTLEDLIKEHPNELFWALNPDLDYSEFDFEWRPSIEQSQYVHAFGSSDSETTQTYLVNSTMWEKGFRELNWVVDKKLDDETLFKLFKKSDMFFVDRSNDESKERFEKLKQQFPTIQKTRYLNSWVETITRCINRSTTDLCWILNSELDYTNFNFEYYPNPWQMKMVHVFGTQWNHWGTTFMVNRETFAQDTKHIKIIEHLSNLNFVKDRKAKATNILYDIVYIDHGNKDMSSYKQEGKLVIKYQDSYINTLQRLLDILPVKKEHYIWIASTVCDYTTFDFTYICDPFAKDQLHVFPSDRQPFGDTFLVDVNKLRLLIEDMNTLEDYEKINYNQSQRVKRLPAPVIVTKEDTHINSINTEFSFPYAVFITEDNKDINIIDNEPMSLWAPESKNIQITSVGGTRIVVPKEAKDYVKRELYDYPYIMTNSKLAKSNPLDIVFFSNGETSAESNYEHLLKITQGLPNKVTRIDGVSGRVKSQHAAAESSTTQWYFLVNAKLKVNSKFDFNWQPDRLQVPKHYIFHASNPVNGLKYGHQAIVANNKKLTLENYGNGLDFTMDSEHEIIKINSGFAMFNTSAWDTWRTAFRECIKLKASSTDENKERLEMWLTVGMGEFNEYSMEGAQHAVEYYEAVNGDFDKLRLSYDWPWLRTYYETKYKL